ncbi:multidrug transporter [Candidatus Magnetomorum sp. HK-1]|nr:multidrug transporter [Candidatus Magnetomorum sp. HK-1]
MFSRRHPYLFFVLANTAMVCGTLIFMSMILTVSVSTPEFGEKVGIIEIDGVITDALPVIQDLQYFRKNDLVKAILIRINSPGGGVAPSQEIFREIQKTKKIKTVIVSMGTVAASGGYYIASAANGIVASSGTITGSIGVIMGFTNLENLFQKIGLSTSVVKSGNLKDIGSPTRPMTLEEKTFLQEFVTEIHEQFISDVSNGRNLPIEEIRTIADGRILTGEQAKQLQLIDRMGNYEDAVQWAGRLGGIQGEISTMRPPKDPMNLLEELIKNEIHSWISKVSTFKQYQSVGYLCPFTD